MAEYAKTARNTVNRYRGRGAYDHETIHAIVNDAPILHVAFNPPSDPFPTILPMIGCMGSFAHPSAPLSAALDLYLHGYVSSRLMRLPGTPSTAKEEAAAAAEEEAEESSTPLCIAATLLDGLVLALTPNHHSMNYRSAVLHGHATLVTDPAEKRYAMQLVTDNVIPDRWANSRVPPTAVEMQSTSILRVAVVDASAKARSGEPGEDRKDERDEAVRGRVWTGVIPTWTAYGAPVPAGKNRVGVPGHVSALVEGRNRENERKAREAAAEV
ncbi:hypothetical protein MMC27_004059 [Xylographa pallens]|nr:hypothetical protein [Xylographa pallens]